MAAHSKCVPIRPPAHSIVEIRRTRRMRVRLSRTGKRLVVSGFVLVTLAGMAATLIAGSTPASASVSVKLSYVALGDSYAAGVGTLDYDSSSGDCARSPEGYPALVAGHASSYVSRACSGATTADVRSKQLSDLGIGTDLVTITAGGNDVGFTNVAATCLLGTDDQCVSAVSGATTTINSSLPGQLDATFIAVQSKAPNARVIVSGYPRLMDEAAASCSLSLTKRQALNRGADALDSVLSARAAAAGFVFSDPRPTFAGHGVCSGSPWINAFSSDHVNETFHPTADGYRLGYFPAVLSATLPVFTPNELPAGYTRCGDEAATCSFPGTRKVAFGAGSYRYLTATGSASCDNTTFGGDPTFGVLKSCYLAPLGGPLGWTQCASENSTCHVGGTTVVAYGANGGFIYKQVNGAAACTSDTFGGDPIFGVVKACYFPPSGAPIGSWTQCANEGSTCNLSGEQSIVYGAYGSFVTARASTTTSCDNTSFRGDPIFGVAKACYRRTGGPVGYTTKCASAGGNCVFIGTRTVAFGEGGGYVYRTFTGGTACAASAFGRDPSGGVTESCYLTP
ncbi:SGNH/GDSL hydrolase family protein [Dactylosporangium sp. CA-092794]|uniref:SGNH/GDSL hydrolase family protein n=1 Tax=Dactylosporangium sp. CA-092794 TaxID=3239929 RepID=UPI003D8E7C7D